jgi:hypothetical protein
MQQLHCADRSIVGKDGTVYSLGRMTQGGKTAADLGSVSAFQIRKLRQASSH